MPIRAHSTSDRILARSDGASQPVPSGRRGWVAILLVVVTLACGPSPDTRLEEIRAQQGMGEFEPTVEPLRELLAKTPDDPELNHLYGAALLGSGQPELAIWPLRKAAEHPDRAIEDGLLLGVALLRGGSADDAVRQLVQVVELAPDRVDIHHLLLQARLRAKQHEEALEDAARLLAKEPGDADALLTRVLALLSLNRPDEAGPALEDLSAVVDERADETAWPARMCAATATFAKEKGDPEAAESLWNKCLERSPGDETIVFGAIEFFTDRQKGARAIEILRKAHEAEPTHLPFVEVLAARLDAAGDSAEAEELLLAATRDGVNDIQAWFALARHHEERNEVTKARDAMAQGLRLIGEAPATLVAAYVDLLIRAGDYDEAETLIAGFEPSPVMVNLLRGRLLLARGQPAQALEALDEGLRLWPDHSVARWLAGRAAEQLGDFDRALEEYGEAVRNDPGNEDAVRSLLRLLEAQGRYRAAIPVLTRYRDEQPQDAEMMVELIRFARLAGEPRLARRIVRRLASLPGQKPLAVAERAAMRAAQAGPAAGVEELRKAGLDLSAPENGPALERLVELLVAEGKAQEASDAVKAALAAHPDEVLFRELRGRALGAQGDREGSRAALESALEIEPSRTSVLVELAALSAAQGDRAAAIALYDRATRAEPDSAEPAWAAIQLVAQDGDAAELERRLEALLAAQPSHAGAAKLLAQQLQGRDPERARDLARRAARFRGGPEARDALTRSEAQHPAATRSAQRQTSD